MRHSIVKLKPFLSGSSPGFTLAEVIVSVGILTIMMSLIGGSLFQALDITRWWEDDILAAKDFRHGLSSFSRDAPNAQSTNLTDGAAPVSSVTITWDESNGTPHRRHEHAAPSATNTNAPTATTLYNYDTDRDNFPGRFLQESHDPENETHKFKYQNWRTSPLSSAFRILGLLRWTSGWR